MLLAKKGNTSFFLELLVEPNDAVWSGGKARSMQLYETFLNNGFTFSVVEEPVRPGKLSMLFWGINGVLKFGAYKPFGMMSLRTTGSNYYRFTYFAKRYHNVPMYIIEPTGFGSVQCAAILKSFGKKIIFIPANIESLAPYDAWTHSLPVMKRFAEELKFYKAADAVFCIAEEEDWLLKILSVKSFFLPYYPPKVIEKKIEYRRERRRAKKQSGYSLYFANFFNPPNLLGFKQFIEDGLYKNGKIKLAGLGIEKVVPLIEGKKEFTVLGELSEEGLEDELLHCDNVILNHFPTSGMLTRIPELLVAGIPVKGNAAALKAYILTRPDENARLHLRELADKSSKQLLEFIEGLY